VPQSGRLGLGISVLSYADELRLGVTADANLLPDPWRLVDGYEAAASQLVDAVAGTGDRHIRPAVADAGAGVPA
jgi:hypothetical protein